MGSPNQEIFEKLGWSEGFQVPVANLENRQLEEQLAKLTYDRRKLLNANTVTQNRVEALRKHIKHLRLENEQNQKLITAHNQQLENEIYNLKTDESEFIAIERNLKEDRKNIKELETQCQSKKNRLATGLTHVEKLKQETEWDEEALLAWEEALKKRDEDISLMEQFSADDKLKYNELEAKRKSLQMDSVTRSNIIQKMVTELLNFESIMSRTGKVIKQQFEEKNALIAQWKDSVNTLKNRDKTIEEIENRLIELQEMQAQQNEIVLENDKFLEQQKKSNLDLNYEIESMTSLNSRLRRDLDVVSSKTKQYANDLAALKKALIRYSSDIAKARAFNKNTERQVENSHKKMKKIKIVIEEMKKKRKEIAESKNIGIERDEYLQHLMECELKEQEMIKVDAKKAQQLLFHTTKVLQETVEECRAIDIQINSANTSIVQLLRLNKDSRKILEKQTEVVYDMNFRIDELEQAILRVENPVQDEEMVEKQDRVAQLEKVLQEMHETKISLQGQVTRIRNEMRRLTIALTSDTKELEALQSKCEAEILYFEIGSKQVQNCRQETQLKQVEENIIQLRISHIQKNMEKEEKSIFSLQRFRLDLDEALKEKLLEISTAQTILLTKRRHLDDDRGRLKADIAVRQAKIQLLQKKYHVYMGGLGRDENGEPQSITQLKIRMAQEKFILKKEGDELDEKIQKAEKEIVAMENTLKVVTMSNQSFKSSLTQLKENDKTFEEMKNLEDELLKVQTQYYDYKNELMRKKDELKETEEINSDVQEKKDHVEKIFNTLEEEYASLKAQEADKTEKLKRAETMLKKVYKNLNKKEVQKYGRDFEIRQMKDINRHVLQRLTELCQLHEEAALSIQRRCAEFNIKLPPKKHTPSFHSESVSSLQLSLSSKHYDTSESSSPSTSHRQNVKKMVLSLNI